MTARDENFEVWAGPGDDIVAKVRELQAVGGGTLHLRSGVYTFRASGEIAGPEDE